MRNQALQRNPRLYLRRPCCPSPCLAVLSSLTPGISRNIFESYKALLRHPLSVSMCAATLISLSTSVQSFPRAVCLQPGQPKPAASPLCKHAAGPRPGEPLQKCFFFKIWVAKFAASFTLESRRRASSRRHSAVRQWKKHYS